MPKRRWRTVTAEFTLEFAVYGTADECLDKVLRASDHLRVTIEGGAASCGVRRIEKVGGMANEYVSPEDEEG